MRCTGKVRVPFGAALLAVALAAGLGYAAADEVQVITTPPATPGQSVTVTTAPAPNAPAEKVTVQQQPDGSTRILHEAITYSTYEGVATVVVKTAPPEPRQEVVKIEARPAENAVWVPGYWRWDAVRSNYEWVSGAWRRAIPGMAWRAGHWVQFANGWEWIPGYWASGPAPTPATATVTTVPVTTTTTTTTVAPVPDSILIVKQAPPAPRVETRPASPGSDYAWIAGHWTYRDGQYTWASGRWERPALKDMMWIPARWIHLPDGTYTFISGHWDYPAETRTYVVSSTVGEDNITRYKDHKEDNEKSREKDGR